ncbi:MAG TPA: hypothetical protein VFK25_02710, partial [Candidatus Binatia bacterium]|nr:hypothetical protein [Candidatus Binatia bacterium]
MEGIGVERLHHSDADCPEIVQRALNRIGAFPVRVLVFLFVRISITFSRKGARGSASPLKFF